MFRPFDWQDLVPLVEGAWLTIQLCTVSGILGVIFGLVLGIARTSPSRTARWISTIYISCVRGIPVLVIIFFVFFGIPLLFPGLEPDRFSSAVIALTCFAGAYVAEIVRGSIEAVAKGQSEAADALGLDYWRKLRYVILPQAVKIMVPPGIGFLIGLVKDSSLVTVTGLLELTHAGNVVTNLTGDPIKTFLIVAAMYFVICYGISSLGRLYERRTGIHVDPLKIPEPAGL